MTRRSLVVFYDSGFLDPMGPIAHQKRKALALRAHVEDRQAEGWECYTIPVSRDVEGQVKQCRLWYDWYEVYDEETGPMRFLWPGEVVV